MSYWLVRFVFLRLLGIVYFVAFLILLKQGIPLLGENGILPAKDFVIAVRAQHNSVFDAFINVPSLFMFKISDNFFLFLAWLGVLISFLVFIGFANSIMLFVLWFLYLSFVHVGQLWYGYGWDIQLLETGFLAIFLVPLLDARPFPRTAAPTLIIWLLRWLAFRINIGSGLIKYRGDSCWKDLTCLDYHFETQPVPNPLSRWFHFQPAWMHRFGVVMTHAVQLISPWLVFPRLLRNIAGFSLLLFQIILIISGNLSFLNWLTLVAVISYFDDSFLRKILPKKIVERAEVAKKHAKISRSQNFVSVIVFVLMIYLSIPVVQNLLSSSQRMNSSFDRLHLLNTYGAFGSITKERHELVFEGSMDGKEWKEYEFYAKPTDISKRPSFISPYHYRLDWQLWFASMQPQQQNLWILKFVWRLLNDDKETLKLIAQNPFPEQSPKFIRVLYYKYEFAPPKENVVWKRSLVGLWLPPVAVENFHTD